MMTSMGISPSGMQASAAVFNVEAVAKQPIQRRDDVVAPVETTNGEGAKADLSLFKMASPSLGQNLDIQV